MEAIVKMGGREYLVRQDLPGTWVARVWDSVGGHYSIHGTTRRQEVMAVKRAKAQLREAGKL